LLKVPTASSPREFDYLLNPQHKDFGKVHLPPPKKFRFDASLNASVSSQLSDRESSKVELEARCVYQFMLRYLA
jgi:hypothetical protein